MLSTHAATLLLQAIRENPRAVLGLPTGRTPVGMYDRVVAGKQSKEIAFELGASPRTIEIHRARVMQKMRARTVQDLVRMALSAGALR